MGISKPIIHARKNVVKLENILGSFPLNLEISLFTFMRDFGVENFR